MNRRGAHFQPLVMNLGKPGRATLLRYDSGILEDLLQFTGGFACYGVVTGGDRDDL